MTMSTDHRMRAQAAWVVVVVMTALLGVGTSTGSWAGYSADGDVHIAAGSALATVPPVQSGLQFPSIDRAAHLANSLPSWAGSHEVGLATALVLIALCDVLLGWSGSRRAARLLCPVGPGGARSPPTRDGSAD
ncbi:hypothetical protein ACG83_17745 [Frankia sp. R43]|uniref:hypothetical protein n=1 Tax=Frankia sp. R43 TaxID=269536 RepID=UPI0006CA26EF|nr:hypothetical protein [Frankia sp. R43]KPM53931.1 hypothetical protein ACG83_17745 [Frankia sp. R43]